MTASRRQFPPVFATNRAGTETRAGERVADEINRLLSGMRTQLADAPRLAIATAFLNTGGYELLADELEQAPRVRLLLGAEPDFSATRPVLRRISKEQIGEALRRHERWLASERDLTGFTREADRAARRMVKWLQAENREGERRVEVRRYADGFLHGKAFITEHPSLPAVLAGSSNFTYAGLASNAELNLGYPSGEHTHLVQEWFNELWEHSAPYRLDELYAARWEPHAPWLIFLRMLWELYGGHFDEDDDLRARTELGLTGFQREGVARMLRILEEHGGVIVADEVGLGKTFMAGEVIKRAASVSRQQVLVIAPAALKAGMWEPFLKQYDFPRRVEVMSYEEFRNRWGDAEREAMRSQLDEYALVVVDEAHNLRNPNAQRTEAVNALVGGSHPKRLMLLTATPVNNTLFDLHSLVSLFIRNDAAFAARGIPSIYQYIKTAEEMDQDALSHEHLFDLLDQVAVRRTRRFVKKHYRGEKIKDHRGEEKTIQFPQPELKRLDYDLDQAGLELVEAVVYALENSEEDALRYEERQRDPDRLMLARYTSGAYHMEANHEFDYQVSNAGLLRSTLLKRLESSPIALANTLGRMVESHRAFLEALAEGWVLAGEALREWTSSDAEDFDEFLEGLDDRASAGADPVDRYHVAELREDVESDLEMLGRLRERVGEAADGPNPKLDKLLERLGEIAAEACLVSRDGVSSGNRRKTIVFSSFADTIESVADQVSQRVVNCADDDPLADFRQRIAKPVFGAKRGFNPETRARIIAGFAPETAGGRERGEDIYDLLFTTDILSEGVNLQQAGRIVNYDLPWNPMRVAQRHGRIDRIGSPHSRVFIDCFFPSAHLDRLLRLEARLRRKLALADAAVGTGQVLPGFESGDAKVFSDIERLRWEDAGFLEERGGAAALSGEEYRRRLRAAAAHASAEMEQARALPYGSGSGFINPRFAGSGYVFCIRVGEGGGHPPRFRFVPVDGDWGPLLDGDDRPVVKSDTLTALVAADPGDETAARELSEVAYDRAFDAWEAAREDVYREWMRLTDPSNLRPDVPKALREATEMVHKHGDVLTTEDRDDLVKRLNTRPSRRIVKTIRELVRSEEEAPAAKIRRLRQLVDEAGLQPPEIPDPLPEITLEDVHLVAWTAVQGAATARPAANR